MEEPESYVLCVELVLQRLVSRALSSLLMSVSCSGFLLQCHSWHFTYFLHSLQLLLSSWFTLGTLKYLFSLHLFPVHSHTLYLQYDGTIAPSCGQLSSRKKRKNKRANHLTPNLTYSHHFYLCSWKLGVNSPSLGT